MPATAREPRPPVGVAILAKAPIAGLAKTRLIPQLGAAGAAALQRWLLQRTVATARAADVGPLTLWCTPTTEHPDFARCQATAPLTLRRQPAGDLGQRMAAAVAAAPAATLLIGTDCPLLTPDALRQAAADLATTAATLIPATDGGYVLLGLRHPAPGVFAGVDWGSGRVLAQTRRRLAAAGLRWREAAPLWDVDRADDFRRLAALFPEVAAFAGASPP